MRRPRSRDISNEKIEELDDFLNRQLDNLNIDRSKFMSRESQFNSGYLTPFESAHRRGVFSSFGSQPLSQIDPNNQAFYEPGSAYPIDGRHFLWGRSRETSAEEQGEDELSFKQSKSFMRSKMKPRTTNKSTAKKSTVKKSAKKLKKEKIFETDQKTTKSSNTIKTSKDTQGVKSSQLKTILTKLNKLDKSLTEIKSYIKPPPANLSKTSTTSTISPILPSQTKAQAKAPPRKASNPPLNLSRQRASLSKPSKYNKSPLPSSAKRRSSVCGREKRERKEVYDVYDVYDGWRYMGRDLRERIDRIEHRQRERNREGDRIKGRDRGRG